MTVGRTMVMESIPASVLETVPSASRVVAVLSQSQCCPRCVLRFLGVRDRTIHAGLKDAMQEWKRSCLSRAVDTQGAEAVLESDDVAQIETESEVEGQPPTKRIKTDTDAIAVDTSGDPPNTTTTTESLSETREQVAACAACLGLLQVDYDDLATQAHAIFKKQGYVLGASNQTFVVSMRLPPQLAIRQRSFSLLINEGLSEEEREQLPGAIDVKEVFRYLMSDAYASVSGLQFDPTSPYMVTVHYTHQETEKEFMFMTKIPEADFKIKTARAKGRQIISGASFEKIAKSVEKLSYQHFTAHGMCPPPAISTLPKLEEKSVQHAAIYVAGRYLKLQRGISNSPWIIGGKRLAEHSVEELIGTKVDAFFRNDEHKFYSSGREDADVLMLGRGRPFYLELINPRRVEATSDEFAALQQDINTAAAGMVEARDLQIVDKDTIKHLKDAADTKSKSYSTLVKLASPVTHEQLEEISQIKDLAVKQRNPTRVPRRADLVRDKVIEKLRVYPAEPTTEPNPAEPTDVIRVDLTTSAGTYVKEFVHGDDGRTTPCLADLLKVDWAKVLELDVLEIHLDWPKATGVEAKIAN
ncbi:putative tRNA pseudouridine synthase Pus10 [Gaertneriomyces sp. JEL0708]|nr:putative tRNA pseudouridine synthase Pus10 [Gaertneriomyces sp. JEL0708]